MKNNFILTFFVLALVYISRYSVTGQDRRAQARDLLGRLNTLAQQVIAFKNEQLNQRSQVNTVSQNHDFGISQNPQMIQINNDLNSRALKRGIQDCIKLRDNGVASLKQTLQTIFNHEAFNKLDSQISTSTKAQHDIRVMQDNLQGPPLENIVGDCHFKPTTCPITTSYPRQMTEITNSMDDNRKLLKTVFDDVYKQSIVPLVPSRITKVIYDPVTQCIKKVENPA